VRNEYREEILQAKQKHWNEFLEDVSNGDVWVANRYISSTSGDGGKTCIPTLKFTPPLGTLGPPTEVVANEEKSTMLAKTMFPGKPNSDANLNNPVYKKQLPNRGDINLAQICRHIEKLSPHKATSTEEIPNVVLKKCADAIIPYLTQIFRAVFSLRVYMKQWHEIITCVLWKLGKPRYDVPKAYGPITLYS
jgi:hypothetical protein